MPSTRRTFVGVAGSTVALAGCLGGGDGGDGEDTENSGNGGSTGDGGTGGGGEADGSNGNTEDSGDSGSGSATVTVRSHEEHGEILVGPNDTALYMDDRDSQGEGESVCDADCAKGWPPLTVEGAPSKGDGVATELSTFERRDGSMQVTAAGWPLYTFASDEEPGHTRGQGASDVWWLLRPDGSLIE